MCFLLAPPRNVLSGADASSTLRSLLDMLLLSGTLPSFLAGLAEHGANLGLEMLRKEDTPFAVRGFECNVLLLVIFSIKCSQLFDKMDVDALRSV